MKTLCVSDVISPEATHVNSGHFDFRSFEGHEAALLPQGKFKLRLAKCAYNEHQMLHFKWK